MDAFGRKTHRTGLPLLSQVIAPPPDPLDPAFLEAWRASAEHAQRLALVFGGGDVSGGPVRYRQVAADAETTEVAARILGIRFACGAVSSALPAVEEDALLVPPPYELRQLSRPLPRKVKNPSGRFKLLTVTAGTYLEGQVPLVVSRPTSATQVRDSSSNQAVVRMARRPLQSSPAVVLGGMYGGGAPFLSGCLCESCCLASACAAVRHW